MSSVEEAAAASLELLADAALRARLGETGRERVRRHFLSTRNLRDYLLLFRRASSARSPASETGGPARLAGAGAIES